MNTTKQSTAEQEKPFLTAIQQKDWVTLNQLKDKLELTPTMRTAIESQKSMSDFEKDATLALFQRKVENISTNEILAAEDKNAISKNQSNSNTIDSTNGTTNFTHGKEANNAKDAELAKEEPKKDRSQMPDKIGRMGNSVFGDGM